MNAWMWAASGLAGLGLGACQILLLKKTVALTGKKTAAVYLAAKMLLWGAAIAVALMIDARLSIGLLAGAAPVYTVEIIRLWMHRED